MNPTQRRFSDGPASADADPSLNRRCTARIRVLTGIILTSDVTGDSCSSTCFINRVSHFNWSDSGQP